MVPSIIAYFLDNPSYKVKNDHTKHAEIVLCDRTKKLDKRKIIVLERYLENGSLALARPCINCLDYLRYRTKIKKIIYSTTSGFITEKINDMLSVKTSALDLLYFNNRYRTNLTRQEFFMFGCLRLISKNNVKQSNLDLFIQFIQLFDGIEIVKLMHGYNIRYKDQIVSIYAI